MTRHIFGYLPSTIIITPIVIYIYIYIKYNKIYKQRRLYHLWYFMWGINTENLIHLKPIFVNKMFVHNESQRQEISLKFVCSKQNEEESFSFYFKKRSKCFQDLAWKLKVSKLHLHSRKQHEERVNSRIFKVPGGTII